MIFSGRLTARVKTLLSGRTKGGSRGNESGIAETGKSDNLPVEVKEKPRGKKKEAVDKNAGQARHAGKAKESPNTVPGINDKAVPLSSSQAAQDNTCLKKRLMRKSTSQPTMPISATTR